MAGLRVLELGCGLGLPSLVAALRGADVLATYWSDEALAVAALNAERNGARIETARLAWADAAPAGGPWDLILGADVLYERRNVDQLLTLLPRLGRDVFLADPGRPALRRVPRQRRSAAGRSSGYPPRSSPAAASIACKPAESKGLCCNDTSSPRQSVSRLAS